MSKKQAALLCGLFVSFLALFFVLHILWPARTFSPMENRMLQQKPAFSLSALFSGQWTSDYETYLTDQFPLRDTWVGAKYVCERALLRRENNGVYFAKGGRLISRFDEPDEKRVEQNFAAVDSLAQNTGLPTRLLLVPTTAYIYRDDLPKGAPSYDQAQLFQRADRLQAAQNIPVADQLMAHRQEYIYYRTDHHWTTAGAWLAYQAYMQAAGRSDESLTQQQLDAVRRETPDFYGTLYSQAGARFYEPDTITWYDLPNQLTIYNVTAAGQPTDGEATGLYDTDKLTVYDKYAMFLHGNNGLSRVQGDGTGKILVIKDSYANCFVPYLTANYADIDVVDFRNYNFGLDQLIADNGYDQILVLYSFDSFKSDPYLYRAGVTG